MGMYLGKRKIGVPTIEGSDQFQINVDPETKQPWIQCGGQVQILVTDQSFNTYSSIKYRVDDYAALLLVASPVDGDLAYVRNSSGAKWNPFTTYISNGFWIYDGGAGEWVSDREAISEQLQINVDDIDALEIAVGNNDADILALQSSVSTNTGNISTNTTNIGTNASDITDLQNDKADKIITILGTTGQIEGGGDLSGNRVFNLANTAVTPGTYTNANITVDQKGRITLASSGSSSSPFYAVEKSEDYVRPSQTTEGLINQQSNTYETYLSKDITPTQSGNYKISAPFGWSINDTGQDILVRLRISDGGGLIKERTFQMEGIDSGGGGPVFNVLSGGLIAGNAGTGTNQVTDGYISFDEDLTASTTYTIELQWTATGLLLESALHFGNINADQKPIT